MQKRNAVPIKEGIGRRLIAIAAVMALLFIWHLASRSGRWSTYVLPSPERVWTTFLKMLDSGELMRHVAISLRRVAVGFSISFALGFSLGVLSAMFPAADPFYAHILEWLRHVPPMSMIPLLILWFGIGETSKLIIIVLTSFLPIYMNTIIGIRQCDGKLVEVGVSLGFGRIKRFFRIILPGAAPSVMVGMRISLGYSWRAIVGAEMIAAASGLGYMILDAQAMSRSDKVIVGILVIGAVGFVTDKLFALIIKALTPGGRP